MNLSVQDIETFHCVAWHVSTMGVINTILIKLDNFDHVVRDETSIWHGSKPWKLARAS
jgi:hypothetical protein